MNPSRHVFFRDQVAAQVPLCPPKQGIMWLHLPQTLQQRVYPIQRQGHECGIIWLENHPFHFYLLWGIADVSGIGARQTHQAMMRKTHNIHVLKCQTFEFKNRL